MTGETEIRNKGGRPRLGEGLSLRLQLVITSEEVEAIEAWRFANRVQTKSEAIRLLCRSALSKATTP